LFIISTLTSKTQSNRKAARVSHDDKHPTYKTKHFTANFLKQILLLWPLFWIVMQSLK